MADAGDSKSPGCIPLWVQVPPPPPRGIWASQGRTSMYKFDATTAGAIIAEESALATLRQYPIETVLATIEDPEAIEDEEDAFNALMAAMYALRPVGFL